jgi:4-amino-4-deoxychorismate lyase
MADFETVILDVLRENQLHRICARINIYYAITSKASAATPLVAAYPYTPDTQRVYRLDNSSLRHDSHLCAHKSMNYMHYFITRTAAEKRGFDDAVLVDRDGAIREATTAALVFHDGERYFTPDVENPFPSVSLEIAKSILPISNVVQVPSKPAILGKYRHAYVLNSLIGMRPVIQIGETEFEPDEAGCTQVTRSVHFP